MKQVTTTLVLSVIAFISLSVALVVHFRTQPGEDTQSELIGEVFYPDFQDPRQAASLRLTVWADAEVKEFEIKKVGDLWTIVDYYDYPVESAEQLNKTAGSVMNIKREFLAGTAKNLHERFGVVNPKDPDAKLKEPNQIGDRVTLTDDSGNVVFDLIIGSAVDQESENEIGDKRELVEGKRYYVRQPDQNETYVAVLNLQIKTDFEDWIDSDLLQIADANVSNVQLLNYDISEKIIELPDGRRARAPVRQNYEELTLEKDGFSWKLDGLNEATEELQSGPVDELSNQFGNLKIVGVDRKPTYDDGETKVLKADLSVNVPKGVDRDNIEYIQRQATQLLGQQGFILGLVDEKDLSNPTLLSENGELKFGTNAGLIYHLVFGSSVTLEGSSFEFSAGETGSSDSPKDAEADSDESKKTDGKTDDKTDDKKKKGKIMSVHVTFDESLIEKPTKPLPPVAPKQPTPPSDDQPQPGTNPDSAKKDEPKSAPESLSPPDLDSKKNADPAKKTPPAKADPEKTNDKKDAPVKKAAEPKTPEPKTPEPNAKQPEEAKKTESGGKETGGCGDDLIDLQEPQEKAKDAVQEKATPSESQEKKAPQEDKSVDPKKGSQESQKEKEKSDDQKKQDPKPGESGPAEKSQKTKDGKAASQEGNDKPQDQGAAEKAAEMQRQRMEYLQAMQQYSQQMTQYEMDLEQYNKDMDAYQKKIKDGQEKVANLNSRFEDWFYIVDAENLAKIKLTRSELVTAKKIPPTDPNGLPGANQLKVPGVNDLPPGLVLPKPPMPTDEPAKKDEGKKQEDDKSQAKKEGEPKTAPEEATKKSPGEPKSTTPESKSSKPKELTDPLKEAAESKEKVKAKEGAKEEAAKAGNDAAEKEKSAGSKAPAKS